MKRSLPLVAIVGRPNVGKSTFFNRVLGTRLAIVDSEPGVTRDRNFSRAEWAGRTFYVVDTGGVVEGSDEPLDRAIRAQAMAAVDEADLIVFVVDGKTGVHPLDERLAEVLRESGKPILLLVNKMDRLPDEMGHHDFWTLGMGEPRPVSAISGRGSGDVLDAIVERLPPPEGAVPEDEGIRVAVVGKPNVGKSSLVNRLLGQDRVVVGEEPGTTRDAVDTHLEYEGRKLVFVDTAGLRRQSRISEDLEYYSRLRTERVIHAADVSISVVDAMEGLAVQDLRVARQAWEAGAAVILIINKWDLVQVDPKTAPEFEKALRDRAPFLRWVPILFVSALTGKRVHKIMDAILEVERQRNRRIRTSEVNDVLRELVAKQPPPHSQGRRVKLRYATQVTTAPPTFLVFSNLPSEVPAHYLRYMENTFRERWGFLGTPIRIRLKKSRERRRA
ncbi:MAG: ribosome biogenesis GTPase Der [Gemmatimonadota bacterium]